MDKLKKIQTTLENATENCYMVVKRANKHVKLAKAKLTEINASGGLKKFFDNIYNKHKVDSVDVEFRKPRGTSSTPFGERITLHFNASSQSAQPQVSTPMPNNGFGGGSSGLNGLNGLSMYYNKIEQDSKSIESKYEAKVNEAENLKEQLHQLQRDYDKLEIQQQFGDRDKKRQPLIDKETTGMILGLVSPLIEKAASGSSGLNAANLSPSRQNIIKYIQNPALEESVAERVNFVLVQFLNNNEAFKQKIEKLIQPENEPAV